MRFTFHTSILESEHLEVLRVKGQERDLKEEIKPLSVNDPLYKETILCLRCVKIGQRCRKRLDSSKTISLVYRTNENVHRVNCCQQY